MKIYIFNIKFETNPNQPIVMTKDPFVLEMPDDVDINWYIAKWFIDNYDVIPTFDWEFLDDEDDDTLDDEHQSANDLAEKIRTVLRRYFETDDNGKDNPEYDPDFSAQDAIDKISAIIGM